MIYKRVPRLRIQCKHTRARLLYCSEGGSMSARRQQSEDEGEPQMKLFSKKKEKGKSSVSIAQVPSHIAHVHMH